MNLMLPLQDECKEPITTAAAQVLWECLCCSGGLDGVNLIFSLQFECEALIPIPIAQVLWERCGCSGGMD